MKIIFLDIDGVLNSPDSFKSGRLKGTKNAFDPKPVGLLEDLLKSHDDVRIVLSSSWRMHEFKSTVQYMEQFEGFRPLFGYMIDQTPDYLRRTGEWCRGDEINDWLMLHDCEEYVIIDDFDDMLAEQKTRFVNVDYRIGLVESDIRKIKDILKI